MQWQIVFALTGFSFAVASPIINQIVDKHSLLLENNDSSTNHEETSTNNSKIEKKHSETNIQGESTIVVDRPGSEQIFEIDIEENIQTPIDQFDQYSGNQLDAQDFNNQYNTQENVENFELVKEGDYYYNDVIDKDPNEIMETAAGFVPIPVFRKRQKETSRRKFATRKLQRRPFANRRHFYFYPYFGYYRPSSLRYYF